VVTNFPGAIASGVCLVIILQLWTLRCLAPTYIIGLCVTFEQRATNVGPAYGRACVWSARCLYWGVQIVSSNTTLNCVLWYDIGIALCGTDVHYWLWFAFEQRTSVIVLRVLVYSSLRMIISYVCGFVNQHHIMGYLVVWGTLWVDHLVTVLELRVDYLLQQPSTHCLLVCLISLRYCEFVCAQYTKGHAYRHGWR